MHILDAAVCVCACAYRQIDIYVQVAIYAFETCKSRTPLSCISVELSVVVHMVLKERL